jgi:hypothetical protein
MRRKDGDDVRTRPVVLLLVVRTTTALRYFGVRMNRMNLDDDAATFSRLPEVVIVVVVVASRTTE